MSDLYDLRYRPNPAPTRTRSFWQDVGDNYKFVYKPFLDRVAQGQFEEDPDFEVSSDMIKDLPYDLQEDLVMSKSQKEFDYRNTIYNEMASVREDLAINKSIGAGLFAGIFDPVNLIPIPTVWGIGFWRGAKRMGTAGAVLTGGQELARGYNDPHYQPIESVYAVGGSTIMSGLLGGTIGGLSKRFGSNYFKATYADDGADEVRQITYDGDYIDIEPSRVTYDNSPAQGTDPQLITYEPKLSFDGRYSKKQPMPEPSIINIDQEGNANISNVIIPKMPEGYKIQFVNTNKIKNEAGNMRIISAYTDNNNKIIYVNPKYIMGELYNKKAWTNPKLSGVKALPEDTFNNPQEWLDFIIMHEVMHTRNAPESLGFLKRNDPNYKKRLPDYENSINELALREIRRQKQNTMYNGKIDGTLGKRVKIKAKPQNKLDSIDDNFVVINPKEIEVSEEEVLKKAFNVEPSNYQKYLTSNFADRSISKLKQPEALPEKAFGLEFFMKASMYGQAVTRYQSLATRQFLERVLGDRNVMYRDAKKGVEPTGDGNVYGGSVKLNAGRWELWTLNDFVKFARDEYQSMFTGVKETKEFLTMDTRYYSASLKAFIANRRDKKVMTPAMFNQEVGRVIMNASKPESFGQIKHPIPQVANVAKKFNEVMQTIKKEGDAVKFFNTKDNLQYRYNNAFRQFGEVLEDLKRYETLLKNPNPTLPKAVLEALHFNAQFYAGRHLDALRNMEKEMFGRDVLSQNASGRLEELLSSVKTQRETAKDTFTNILKTVKEKDYSKRYNIDNEEIKKFNNYLKDHYEEDVKILKTILEDSATNPMSPETRNYVKSLIERLKSANEFKKIDVGIFKFKDTEFVATSKQISALNRLLKRMKDPMTINQKAYYASLKRGMFTVGKKERQTKAMDEEAFYIHRDFMIPAIEDNREAFTNFLKKHFLKNPKAQLRTAMTYLKMGAKRYKYKKQYYPVNEALVDMIARDKAIRTVNTILRDSENLNIDNVHAKGTNAFVKLRKIDIPNYMFLKDYNGIADFIDTDVVNIQRIYLRQAGVNLEMARAFDGDRFATHEQYRIHEDVIMRYGDEFEANPREQMDKLNMHRDNVEDIIDVTLGRINHNTDMGSRSNQLGQGLMNFTQTIMMGSATVAGLADPMKIVLAHGFKNVFKRELTDFQTNLLAHEAKLRSGKATLMSGEGFDTRLNVAGQRVADQADQSSNTYNRAFGKIGDMFLKGLGKINTGFYTANLLNQWTALWKRQVAYISNDNIYRLAEAVGTGKRYPEFEVDLKIYTSLGFGKEKLGRLYKLWTKHDGPKKYKGKDTYFTNIDKWMDEDPILARDVLAAVRAEQNNTIVTPSDTDKTYLHYGKAKFSHWNKDMKDRHHNLFKIPLQFMSWAFASVNRIMISTLQGRHKGVVSGMMAMFSAGMLSDYIRNPGWWAYKSEEERILKAIEYSGLTAYFLDINNILEVMSDNNFGIRPMMGEKNPFTGTPEDIISEPFGPVGGLGADLYKLFHQDTKLDRRASIARRMIPFNNIFYLKSLFNSAEKNVVDILE
jgi:hypothetical protein